MTVDTNTRKSITSLSGPALPFWRRIRTTLIVYFVLLALLPTAGTMAIVTSQLREQAQDQAMRQLESVASLKVQLLDQWLVDSQSALHTITAADAEDQRFSVLTTPQAFNFVRVQEAINGILGKTDQNHDGFVEIFFYDLKGNIQSSSIIDNIGKSVTRQPYYSPSLADEYTQSPYYQVGSGELTTLITHPVRNINGQVIGVLAGRLNLDVLGQIMLEDAGLPESAETYLVSAQSNYLLTPSRSEGYEMTRAYHSQGIDRALAGQDGSGTYDDYRDPPVRVFGVYRWIPGLQAALLAEQDESEALLAFSEARFNAILLGIGAAVLAALVGLVAAARFSQPILALTHAATRIAIGDLKERATVRQRNELGVLAAAFNDMADQLQQSISSLEDRVEARTRDLFLTLEVGEMASRVLQQADLLPHITDFIREQFDLYYTQVYLIDEAGRSAVLAAGTGEVGEELLGRGHRLDLDAMSIVGRAVQTRRPVLVSDTATSTIHRPNPLLPDTRSEVAIPLLIGDEVLGVLDMQARQPETFRDDNLPVFQAMANQLASSVRSAQAYTETQIAVARADALNRRLTAEAWESYLGRVGEDRAVAYEYNLQDVRPVASEPLPVSSNGNPRRLALPVKLRGQPIGTIQLEEDTARDWSPDEKELVEDVAERLALALDQFRAFDDTQKRATEMEAVAEVGAQAAATLDPDRLLWTVSELVRARFDLYHAHVYLLDDAGESLILAAGAGEAGRFMVAHGHKIALAHQHSLVARAARSRAGVVVNDVTQAPDFLPNPMLPRTRSEMAVPMIVGDEVIGVLDVQSERIGRFTGADLQVNATLASQIAVAVQNARSFTQIQERSQNLEREQAALVSLAQDPAFSEGNLGTALQQVTSVAAQVMNVDRVSVWFFNHKRTAIECRMLYERTNNQFASGV
ncbi:MAG: GAF domain-containing protein, partial [Chloroflexi bacterium]